MLAICQPVQAGWSDFLDKIIEPKEESRETTSDKRSTPDLNSTELSEGLKQALDSGVQHAVELLGREDGFLKNPRVRIPIPESLGWAEKGLRAMGQDQVLDDFQLSMNRAAEQAMPMVLEVFQQSIRQMTLEDARGILQGPEDAATAYFRRTSEPQLRERIRPVVSETTQQTGVTQQYKAVVGSAGSLGSLLPKDATDLDGYVTQHALDGLFLTIAEEEKRIRKDPMARSTELMRKVFSQFSP